MITRIITGIVALAAFVTVILLGETVFEIAIAAISLFMLYELYGAITHSKPVKVSGFASAVFILLGIHFNMLEMAVTVAVILSMLFLVFLHSKITYRELLSVQLLTVYVTLFMSFIPRLGSELGFAVMGIIFIIAWGSDTAAYFCGTFFGKHKLIPKVSPKKTVEGSVGAIIVTALLCAVYLLILDKTGYFKADAVMYIGIAVIGAVASALSQLGDLAASAIKRDCQIKDYGKIFPGHGGFMDRFDSVILVAPVVYYLCKFIIM